MTAQQYQASFCAQCVEDGAAADLAFAYVDGKRVVLCRDCRGEGPRRPSPPDRFRGYDPSPSIGGLGKALQKVKSPPAARQPIVQSGRQRGFGCNVHRIPVIGPDGKSRDALEALQSVDAPWIDDARYLGCQRGPDGMLNHVFDSRPLTNDARIERAQTRRAHLFSEDSRGDSDCVLAPDAVIPSREDDEHAIASVLRGDS